MKLIIKHQLVLLFPTLLFFSNCSSRLPPIAPPLSGNLNSYNYIYVKPPITEGKEKDTYSLKSQLQQLFKSKGMKVIHSQKSLSSFSNNQLAQLLICEANLSWDPLSVFAYLELKFSDASEEVVFICDGKYMSAFTKVTDAEGVLKIAFKHFSHYYSGFDPSLQIDPYSIKKSSYAMQNTPDRLSSDGGANRDKENTPPTSIPNPPAKPDFIAVVDFTGNNVSEGDCKALTDRFRVELYNTRHFKVYEREMVKEILKEQKFQYSGCVTDACMVEIGKMIGVNQIVGGSVSKVGKVYSVSARIINVETGEIENTGVYDNTGDIGGLLTEGMMRVAIELIK